MINKGKKASDKRFRFILAGGLFLTLAGMSAVTGTVDPKAWFVDSSKSTGFVLESLVITGHVETDRKDILKRLDMDRGTPLMAIDLIRAQSALEALPWVKAVRVERQLPDTLAVSISERKAFGLWQSNGQVHLIDPEGAVIPGQALDRFKGLVLFVGAGANKDASRLLQHLDEYPDLVNTLTTAVRVGERRWDLIFEGGVRVKFPEDIHASAFRKVMKTFSELEEEHRLLARDVTVIDLRVPGQLVMRLNPEARQMVKADYEKT